MNRLQLTLLQVCVRLPVSAGEVSAFRSPSLFLFILRKTECDWLSLNLQTSSKPSTTAFIQSHWRRVSGSEQLLQTQCRTSYSPHTPRETWADRRTGRSPDRRASPSHTPPLESRQNERMNWWRDEWRTERMCSVLLTVNGRRNNHIQSFTAIPRI